MLRRQSFTARLLVIDKTLMTEPHMRKRETFYNFLVQMILEHDNGTINDATPILDESVKGKQSKRELTTYLRRALNAGRSQRKITAVRYHKSYTDNLIQAADMLSGAVSARYHKGDSAYFDSIRPIFGESLSLFGFGFGVSVLWWIGVTAVATWILLRTRAGNWIFAVGGAQNSARQVGVPVLATKVGLFMGTAGAAWLVGMIALFQSSTVTSATGIGDEFIFIICAVVGGCLLTGGYGSAIGAALGALIYGMTRQGIPYAGWDSDWLKAFLGVMLLGAVLVNDWVRRRVEASR
jgi:ABC-type xylose transport system permease subunit